MAVEIRAKAGTLHPRDAPPPVRHSRPSSSGAATVIVVAPLGSAPAPGAPGTVTGRRADGR